MIRPAVGFWVAIGAITLASASALASPRILTVPSKRPKPTAPFTPNATNTLFLDRCINGCNVRPGADDAASGESEIATVAATIPMYAWAPGEWEGVVQCMKDVYSPYNVVITDTQPTTGVYNRLIVGGSLALIGGDGGPGVCGLVPVQGCTPQSNAISFAFTDDGSNAGGCIDAFQQEDDNNAIWGMCWVAAQESAHAYGLDHEFMFANGMSACDDPMTYREDCGGEKFFRNAYANCSGNDGQPKAACGEECGSSQNSHQVLLAALGPGTPTTPAPTATLVAPMTTTIADAGFIAVTGLSVRGVATVDLYLNGYQWLSDPGAAFGPAGQPMTTYHFNLPANVPDGVIDIDVKVADDIGLTTDVTTTVTKGVPCVDATTCLAGQQCSADGKCFWDAPTGMLGDPCTYSQFCVNGECEGATSDKMYCSTDCVPGVTDACDMGYECAATANASAGYCLPDADSGGGGGGCCSVGGGGFGAAAGHGAVAAAVLAMLARRRRRTA